MYKSILRSRKNARKNHGGDNMPYADGEEQTYGFVQALLGNGRVSALCNDGTVRMGRICGAMRRTRRAVVEKGDVVLCCTRAFDAGVVDVVHRYTSDEVRTLAKNAVLGTPLLRLLTGECGGSGNGTAVAVNDAFAFEDDDDPDIPT